MEPCEFFNTLCALPVHPQIRNHVICSISCFDTEALISWNKAPSLMSCVKLAEIVLLTFVDGQSGLLWKLGLPFASIEKLI